MALPLSLQIVTAFLGENQGSNSILMPEVYSTGGSQNTYHDKFGRVRKISGRSRYEPAAQADGQVMAVGQLYTSLTMTGTPVLAWVFGDDAGSFFSLKTMLGVGTPATSVTWADPSVSNITIDRCGPDFAQWSSTLYMASSWLGVKAITAGPGAVLVSSISPTQSPTPTATESISGNLNGTYQYKLVSIHGTTGARKLASAASSVLTTTDKSVTVSWTADADTNQGGYEIYRTTGTGKLFYFIAYVDGRATTSYTDNNLDAVIFQNRVMEEHGDAPPTVAFVEGHKGRMWWGSTATNPDRVYWSDAGLPESVFAQNYVTCSDTEIQNDILTGMQGGFEDALIISTERALWRLSGTGAIIGNIADWTLRRTNARTGWVSNKTVVKVPVGAKYLDQQGEMQTLSRPSLAYISSLSDIRLFDGDGDIVISNPVKDTLQRLTYGARSRCHGVHDPVRSQFIWWIPTNTSTAQNLWFTVSPDTAVVWNYYWGTWSVWTDQKIGASRLISSDTSAGEIWVGSGAAGVSPRVFSLFTSDGNDGAPIEAIWTTKPIYGSDEQGVPMVSTRKRWRWVDLIFKEVDPDVTFVVEWLDGNSGDTAAPIASTTINPLSSTLVTSDASSVTTASGSVVTTSPTRLQAKIRLEGPDGDYLHSEGIRLRIREKSANGNWALESATFAFQALPGQKRRMDS